MSEGEKPNEKNVELIMETAQKGQSQSGLVRGEWMGPPDVLQIKIAYTTSWLCK